MTLKSKIKQEKYYFSKRLKNCLAKIPDYPLTIVQAPSGFGKTTAVREYADENLSKEIPVYWYTCLGESMEKAWYGICELLSDVDIHASNALKNLDLHTMDSLADMAKIIRKMQCGIETYLIMDNFQLIEGEMLSMLIHIFAVHCVPNLHIIIITQELEVGKRPSFYNDKIHYINAEHFIFDKESISRYFRMSGLKIKNSDLDSIHRHAQGWVAAVRLHLINYEEKGAFEEIDGIRELLESALLYKLTEEEQNFLMALSVLESFTLHQATIILGENTLSDKILKIMMENIFIRQLPNKHTYCMHSLLKDFLRNRLYTLTDVSFQSSILKRAGEACLAISDYYEAIQFFYKNEDYDAFLSLPLREDYFTYNNEINLIEWIVSLVKKCPKETMMKYPISLITFVFQFILFGRYEEAAYLCETIDCIFKNAVGLNQNELCYLKGEMAFVKSFTEYNDIERMVEYYKTAYDILGKPSRFPVLDAAWTFGGVSVLYMFWNRVGELEKTIECLEYSIPYYTKLTHGHGTGGDRVMKAEIMLMNGKDKEAEELCYEAIYLAKDKRQISICFCAQLILARIALLRGDANMYKMSIKNIEKYLDLDLQNWQNKYMVDLCMAMLATTIGEESGLPDLVCEIDRFSRELYILTQPYCHIIYGRYLLNKKNYNEISGIMPTFIDMAKSMNYQLPQVYEYIYLAVAKKAQGKNDDAKIYLNMAITIAMPDDIYLPFAENSIHLLPMLEEYELLISDGSYINAIKKLCKRQSVGVNRIKKTLVRTKNILTTRETEVAILAKEGHAVKRIAQILFISDETVKTILKNIYSKLDIHSKVELAKVNLE